MSFFSELKRRQVLRTTAAYVAAAKENGFLQ